MKLPVRDATHILPWAAVILIAAVYTAMGAFISRFGDDVYYSLTLFGYNSHLDMAVDHYNVINGRLANIFAAWLIDIRSSRILLFLLNGAMTGLLFYMVPRSGGLEFKRSLASLTIIAATAFLPGWAFLWNEWICLITYVWTSAIALLMLSCATCGNPDANGWWRWCLTPVCLISGALHEGLSMILIPGIPLLFIVSRTVRRYSPARLAMLTTLWCGAFFPFFSPAYWTRVNSREYNFDVLDIIMYTGLPAIILFVAIFLLFLLNRTRLLQLLRSPWIILAWGAVTSIILPLAAGFPGRPGWFGQIFALAALAGILASTSRQLSPKWTSLLSWAVFLSISCHFCAVLYWQYRMSRDTRSLITNYTNSPDGLVYLDYIEDYDLPWYILRKTRGVPDADDLYYRGTMHYGYGFGKTTPLNIAPAAMRDWTPDSLPVPRRIRHYIVSARLLNSGNDILSRDTVYTLTVVPARSTRPGPSNRPVLYLYSPVDHDPGTWQ